MPACLPNLHVIPMGQSDLLHACLVRVGWMAACEWLYYPPCHRLTFANFETFKTDSPCRK